MGGTLLVLAVAAGLLIGIRGPATSPVTPTAPVAVSLAPGALPGGQAAGVASRPTRGRHR